MPEQPPSIYKSFFIEPKIPVGILVLFLILSGVAVWTGLRLGELERTPNLSGKHAIGEEISTEEFSLVVNGVRRDKTGIIPFAPRPGYEFVVADITITNNSPEPFDLIPFLHFHVKDSAGNVFGVSAVPSALEQLSGQLLPYDKIHEEIGFEVPAGADNLTLYYEPNISGQEVYAVTLNGKRSIWTRIIQ